MKGTPAADELVRFADVRPRGELLHALTEAVGRVVASGAYVLGTEVERFESAAAAYLGVKHAIAVSSGSDALVVALTAAGVGKGGEVVTSPLSFFATAESVLRVGATPRFVDVDPDSLALDAKAVAAALGPASRAVLPVHLYGIVADVNALSSVAAAAGVAVVEDAAQAFGSRRAGRSAGTFGTAGCYSFFPTKALGALGDAGLVVTGDETVATRCRALRAHGGTRPGHHEEMGGNYRLDAVQAAALGVKLPRLDGWMRARRAHAETYDRELGGLAGVSLVRRACAEEWNGAVYTVRIAGGRRDELRRFLAARGVETAVYYPRPLHLQPALAGLGYRAGDLPVAERAALEVLSLPVRPDLTDAERSRVIDGIRAFFA